MNDGSMKGAADVCQGYTLSDRSEMTVPASPEVLSYRRTMCGLAVVGPRDGHRACPRGT